MKLFIPFSYYHPEQCAGLFVIDDMTTVAAQQGISSLITVPTPTRNVPEDAVWSRDEALLDGMVRVHRFRMFGEGKSPVLRALRYLLCEVVQLHYMLWKDYDVVFIDSTPPIQGLKLPIVRLFRKKPVVYNAQDLFPETLSGARLAEAGGFLWKVGMWISKLTFRNSDKIIAISDDIKKSIVARGVPEEKIVVVYNWVDENAIVPITDDENPLFSEFSIEKDSFRVVYAGNLGHAQNIKIILEAASKLKDDESIKFIIFGKGGLENDIRERIKKEGLTNVMLLPLQPYDRVSHVYSLGNVDVVSCKEGLGGSAMPSKTWSIMSTGRPVLASFDEGELKTIIEKNDCGMFTKAGDIDAFVGAIKQLASQKERCAEMGRNGREFILHNLTKEVGTRKYVDVIKRFASKS